MFAHHNSKHSSHSNFSEQDLPSKEVSSFNPDISLSISKDDFSVSHCRLIRNEHFLADPVSKFKIKDLIKDLNSPSRSETLDLDFKINLILTSIVYVIEGSNTPSRSGMASAFNNRSEFSETGDFFSKKMHSYEKLKTRNNYSVSELNSG